ncbi:MAG: hypothetical protein H7318_17530 [Oligoflexus sp.]|nr:hypothetical protein [Oligoflexus sp.]
MKAQEATTTKSENVIPSESITLPSPTVIESVKDQAVLKALPRFALLVDNLSCGLCHVKVLGDVVSTKTVAAIHQASEATIMGDWLVAGKWEVNKSGAKVQVTGDKKEDYSGPEVPTGFVSIDMTAAKAKASGSLKGFGSLGPVNIQKTHRGNIVLVGTTANPIQINGDVMVEGDVIISGPYQGVGTLYASGSVYIPSDLIATHSVFPYPDTKAEATAMADIAVKDAKLDGLGIAAAKNIYLGNIEFFTTDPNRSAGLGIASLDFKEMYKWYTQAAYQALYTVAAACSFNDAGKGSLNVVDAFLHTPGTITGVIVNTSYSIRGGIFAGVFNVVNGNRVCDKTSKISPIHGRNMSNSYVEYDWRLATGKFPILERLGESLISNSARP